MNFIKNKLSMKECKSSFSQYLSSNRIIIEPDREVLIYGAGNTSVLYESCFEKEKIVPQYFIDASPLKQNTLFQGKTVIAPEQIKIKCRNPIVFICSVQPVVCESAKKTLDDLGVENHTIDAYIFSKRMNEVITVFDMLEDENSKALYASLIMKRMKLEEIEEDMVSEKQYFAIPELRRNNINEIFVDCGAYVGDSLEKYIETKLGIFGKIYAFEPCKRNFDAMQYRVERLSKEWALSKSKIELIQAGIGANNGSMYVHSTNVESPALGATMTYQEDGTSVPVYSIDEYFVNEPIGFIKADIESFEELMLQGAQKTIVRDKPKISVCIYHNASDMYRIPILIKSFDSTYKISVRHHYFHDYAETVLYAY